MWYEWLYYIGWSCFGLGFFLVLFDIHLLTLSGLGLILLAIAMNFDPDGGGSLG